MVARAAPCLPMSVLLFAVKHCGHVGEPSPAIKPDKVDHRSLGGIVGAGQWSLITTGVTLSVTVGVVVVCLHFCYCRYCLAQQSLGSLQYVFISVCVCVGFP